MIVYLHLDGAPIPGSLIDRAALRPFVEKGVNGTGIRDAMAAAGVSENALYRHYKSKDALVWALFADSFVAFARRLDALQAKAQNTRARSEAMIYDDVVVRNVIRDGIARGEIPAMDVELATAMTAGLVLQPTTFAAYGRIDGPLSPHAPRIAAAAWHALNASPTKGSS